MLMYSRFSIHLFHAFHPMSGSLHYCKSSVTYANKKRGIASCSYYAHIFYYFIKSLPRFPNFIRQCKARAKSISKLCHEVV